MRCSVFCPKHRFRATLAVAMGQALQTFAAPIEIAITRALTYNIASKIFSAATEAATISDSRHLNAPGSRP